MASDDTFKDYFVAEFVEAYKDGVMSRRDALSRLAALTGMGTAAALLAACAPAAPPPAAPTAAVPTAAPPTPMPTSVAGPGVSESDPALIARKVQFPGPAGTLMAYFAHPKGNGPYPTVLVAHENQGLIEPHMDITRRYAKAGYAALAVDLLSRQGGADKFTEPAQRIGALGTTPIGEYIKDWQAGIKWVQEQPAVRKDRLGFTGFCAGGGVTWRVILNSPEIRAAVPFYGPIPPDDELVNVPKIQAAVLAMYGGEDPNVNSRIPIIEEAMKQAGKTYEKIIYQGAPHSFFNDTTPRYHEASAKDAWPKTLAWFDKYLRA